MSDPILDAEAIVAAEAHRASLNPLLRFRYHLRAPSPLRGVWGRLRVRWEMTPAPVREQVLTSGAYLVGMLIAVLINHLTKDN